MFKFDNRFLDSVGLADLPDSQKEAFLQYAQDQLEIRIGESMSESLNDDQLSEFERIIDNDPATLQGLLDSYGDYQNDEIYQTLKRNTGAQDGDANLLSDFVTAKWLNQNCPQYQQIIKESLTDLQNEIREQKDAILAAE
ncbi:MAG: DUF5663 domain-containing protein [Candidatus Saccharibacteria bacterium]|nr:DUF5663 domain-containing protein [Candidatus Saccharibacteria bacterium]